MKKTVLKISVIITAILTLCGCVITKEDENYLDEVAKEAKQYIEKKYNKSFDVKESKYITQGTMLWPTRTGDISIKFTDGTEVYYFDEIKIFKDDYQYEEITLALRNAIWKPLLEKIAPYKFLSNETYLYFGDYFHEYFNGDIEDFTKNEEINLSLYNPIYSTLYLISKDEDSWKDRFDIINKTFNHYFNGSSIPIAVITPELFNKISNKDYYPKAVNVGMVGCWASGYTNSIDIQHYIKIAKGVYVTSSESNFILEEGDITLKEVMTAEQLQKILDEVAENKGILEEDKYYINPITPIYELEFSDRVKNQFASRGDDAAMDVYVKLDVKELNVSDDYNLYSYPILRYSNGNAYYHSVSAHGNKLDGESDIFYIFQNVHKDYFWIGI